MQCFVYTNYPLTIGSFISLVLIIFLWRLIHSFLISFINMESYLLPLASPPEGACVLIRQCRGNPGNPAPVSPQLCATVVHTHSEWGRVGTKLLQSLLRSLSFTSEIQLNSLRLNEIMIQFHTTFYI